MPWNIQTRNAQNFPLRVSALHGCYPQGAFIELKQCFRNGPLYAAQLHAWSRIKIGRLLLSSECTHTTLPGLYPSLGVKVAPGRLLII
jgi:hypothetical protein